MYPLEQKSYRVRNRFKSLRASYIFAGESAIDWHELSTIPQASFIAEKLSVFVGYEKTKAQSERGLDAQSVLVLFFELASE